MQSLLSPCCGIPAESRCHNRNSSWARLAQASSWAAVAGCFVLLAGCNRSQPQVVQAKPPEVSFVHPHIEYVRDYEDYTGHTEAFKTVEVRARVTGELASIQFKDGTDVTANHPLFEIDKRPFQAELDSATATVHQMDGDLKRKKILLERVKELRLKGTVSQEDLDNSSADFEVAKASLELARAKQQTAELNLSFCEVKSPITGRIDRRMIDVGNQVMANNTLLTTVRTEDPMYAYFDVDERTVLGLRVKRQRGEIKSARDTHSLLDVGLSHETGFSLQGFIDYGSNAVDRGTGTLRVRVLMDNPDKTPRLLSHGMFVRIRFWIGDPTPAVLVPEGALVSDQGKRHLFVLTEDDKVEYREVETGLQQGSMRVIKNDPKTGKPGVTTKDRIIVSGLQRVRAGIKVSATEKQEKHPELVNPVTEKKTQASAAPAAPKAAAE